MSAKRAAKFEEGNVAEEVNLRTDDLPQLSSNEASEEVVASAGTRAITRCGGALPQWEAGAVRSVAFHSAGPTGPFQNVRSAVLLGPSAVAVARSFAADRNAKVLRCLARQRAVGLQRAVGPTHVVASLLSLPLGQLGPHSAIRFRVETVYRPLGAGGTTERQGDIEDVIGFAIGRTEAALSHQASAPMTSEERRLVRLLYERARAAIR